MAEIKRKLESPENDTAPRKRFAEMSVAPWDHTDHQRQTNLLIQTDPSELATNRASDHSRSPSVLCHSDHSEDSDSLFDEPRGQAPLSERVSCPIGPIEPARRTVPPIPGLFLSSPTLLPSELAYSVMQQCLEKYFHESDVNQVMLFSRARDDSTSLPSFLNTLLPALSDLLKPIVPPKIHSLLFPLHPTRARQAILNLYQPGEGITPHIDLLGRFGDGIIGVSLGSGCVMRFDRVENRGDSESQLRDQLKEIEADRWELYLPERSVLVLSGDARYQWTHGIERLAEDFVERPEQGSASGKEVRGQWVARGVRLSITFRWLLPGAEVVGGLELDQ
jgi:hypothetical protein